MTVVTPRSGFDLEYYLNRVTEERTAGGYYLNAAVRGEAGGRWFGEGAEVLGLADGQKVAKDPYIALYNMIDPRTGEKLPGRAPGNYKKFDQIFQAKLAVEPHATGERWLQLEREAAQEVRRSPVYTDMTAAHAKSISIMHGAFRENARRAHIVGDAKAEAVWRARELRIQEILQAANREALRWIEEHAGYVRTGDHRKTGTVEGGRWAKAKIAVTTWLQGTNRDGEMHDHSHNVIARMALCDDGIYRAVDTMALRNQIGAMAAIVDAHVQSALTREFGVRWRVRADGKGHEIEGITDEDIALFSTRTQSVNRKTAQLARDWARKYGREPNARELMFLADEANLVTREGKDDEVIDWDKLAAKWDHRFGGKLAELAGETCHWGGRPGHEPAEQDTRQAMADALAKVETRSTWTRSDLMRALSWSMGDRFSGMRGKDRQALLVKLAEDAITGGEVACLEAPEWPPVPQQLIRDLDGRSVFTRPGTTRYATQGQLSMEDRLVQQAQRVGAPRLTREFAAAQLGATPEQFERVLCESAQTHTEHTHTGLRVDQGAMIFHAMTDHHRVSVGVGPAGSGKTYAVAAGARAWEAAGGRVIGLTTSQTAANVLTGAGLRETHNTAKFREKLKAGRLKLQRGTLLVVDEGSMMSMPGFAFIIDLAERHDCKVFITGDPKQLTSVEAGGGMRLIANRMGFTQLAVPVRFNEEWEGPASLRLRIGDKSVLDDYAEHGRIWGADRERALDEARRSYVAARLAGEDCLLMAYSHEDCRLLSRLIRDDLVHLGIVDSGETVLLSHGARASTGDLIICRKNDNKIITDWEGEKRHGLANGDILRIESINKGSVSVRRLLEADPGTGAMRFADTLAHYPAKKLHEDSDLAYAVTGHAGQGGTVRRGLAWITGHESLEWLYVALTRGKAGNCAIAVTQPAEADPAPGTKAAPELQRRERMLRERDGLPEEERQEDPGEVEKRREPIAVMADCMERENAEEAATAMRDRELADADHLAVLWSRWNDLAMKQTRERYENLLRDSLPPEFDEVPFSEAKTWLFRSLRQAECAGLDAGETLKAAINARTLAGVEDISKVLYSRLGRLVNSLVPMAPKPWSERVPVMDDPGLQEYMQHLAEATEAKEKRTGEFIAETQPVWAIRCLGPMPEDDEGKAAWTLRAQKIESFRQRWGVGNDIEVIGHEPSPNNPEMRQEWFAAHLAVTNADEVDLKSLPDRSLWHMRNSYKDETGWAPPHVGKLLRDVRMGAATMNMKAIRSQAEAQAADSSEVAARHLASVDEARELEAKYREHEAVLDAAMEERREWDKFSEGPRSIAVRAQSELVSRHPDQEIAPLKTAEPLVPEGALDSPEWWQQLDADRAKFRKEMESRQGVRVPGADEDDQDEGEAWPTWVEECAAILQPAQPAMPPAPGVKHLAEQREAGA